MTSKSSRLPADDAHPKLDKADYEDRLQKAQFRMRTVALACHTQGLRGVVVVEGGDTAGKGGAIRRLIAELDPRFFRVWPIGPPTPEERQQHYLQRFWKRLPRAGEIAIFDRSWYGRVLVERVDGLIPADRWRVAYDEINAFEQMLSDDGIRLAKFYFHVTREEQQARLVERVRDRFKWWKINEADIRAHLAYDTYCEAAEEMIQHTSNAAVPWHVIAADHKFHARLELLDAVADCFSAGIDTDPTPLTPDLRRLARDVLGVNGDAGAVGDKG